MSETDALGPREAAFAATEASAAPSRSLRLRSVSKSFQGRRARTTVFQDLAAAIPLDRVNLVFGPNGSGKSTLLRVIAGLVTPDAGELDWPGSPRTPPPMHYAGAGAGVLYGKLSALENVHYFAAVGGHAVDTGCVARLLRDFHLEAKAHELVETLSKGTQQKVLLLRSLACRCPLVLMDEPTEYLDDAAVEILVEAIARRARGGDGFIIATHDQRLRRIPHARACIVGDAGLREV